MTGLVYNQQKVSNQEILNIDWKGKIVIVAEENVVAKRPVRLVEFVYHKRQ